VPLYCRFCGTQISEDSVFCSSCGRPVQSQPPNPPQAAQASQPQPTQPGPPKEIPQQFPSPVFRIVSVTASTYVGQEIDLEKLTRSSPGAAYNPKTNPNFVNYRTKDDFGVGVLKSGKIVCVGAYSEDEARSVVQKAVGELDERRIPSPPALRISINSVLAIVFFKRGIDIQAMPQHVRDSLYVHRTGDFLQGTYNKGGTVLQLTSRDEVLKAVNEASKGMGLNPLTAKNSTHFGYCKVPSILDGTTGMAQMIRGDDRDGKMLMTGFVEIDGSKNEAEAREYATRLGKMLEESGVFGPLTPIDRIPGEGRENPKQYDYFADDQSVWASHTGPRGFAVGYIAPILIPTGFTLPQRVCYNCMRRPVSHDGLYWVENEWWKSFRDSPSQFVNIGTPPQAAWICPECDRCVVCGVRGTRDSPLRSQSLVHEKRIPTVLFYCKNHDAMRMQSTGLQYKKVPKELRGAWAAYLTYQADKMSALNTPASKERLDGVKDLMKEFR